MTGADKVINDSEKCIVFYCFRLIEQKKLGNPEFIGPSALLCALLENRNAYWPPGWTRHGFIWTEANGTERWPLVTIWN